MYINCKTYFSLRYGTFKTKELVKRAVDKGIGTLALTNINSTCDIWDFVKFCQEEGIKPVTGVEIRNTDKLLYVLLAANNNGLKWIHDFISIYLLAKKEFPDAYDHAFFEDSGDGFVIYPANSKPLENLLVNERVGVLPWEVNKLFGLDLKTHADKFVIRQPVTVQDKVHYNLHRLLRCIDKNILLSKLPLQAQAHPEETFVSPGELLDKFKQYPFIVTNTYKLMEACNIDFEFNTDKNKKTFGGALEDDRILLEKLAIDGFSGRYGEKNKAAKERLFKELKIIDELGFNSYFLINHDIIRYAQSRGFYYVGRGSGANSIVAYCLRITDVDPIELNLYFERFLNPHRTSPPDFDIDFSWTDRNEVIDYIFKRYGKKSMLHCWVLIRHFSTMQSFCSLGKYLDYPLKK